MQKLRHYVYSVLEEHDGGTWGRFINILLIALIIANVLVVVFESEKEFAAKFYTTLIIFEYISLFIFGLEYILRIWIAPENKESPYKTPLKIRLHYMVTPMAIIDLIAILPLLLGFFFDGNLLMLRILRLIRGFKITRYSHSMSLLMDVLKREAPTLFSTFVILGALIILAATGIHLVERDQQPENFGSIPKALWWATVTLTTIGYGDVVPITILGKIFGGIIAILGITMAALPAGILASGFTSELNRRRDLYRYHVAKFLDEGDVKLSGVRNLNETRQKLGISQTDAKMIKYELKQEIKINSEIICPYCHTQFFISHPPGVIRILKNT
jgi:voltage-gated potassium channel